MKDTIYGNIKVPIGLLTEVDRIISDENLGYTSRSQFCITAIRVLKESYLNDANQNYQPLSGEERGEHKHEQMAESTSTQSNTTRLDNAQGESHRANEKRVEDPKGKIESRDGEDDPTS